MNKLYNFLATVSLILLFGFQSFSQNDCGVIYVRPTGNTTNNGTINQPVSTISAALNLISPTRRHIKIYAGNYTETSKVILPANVIMEGNHTLVSGEWVKSTAVGAVTQITINSPLETATVGGVTVGHYIGVQLNGNNITIKDMNLRVRPNGVSGTNSSRGRSIYGIYVAGRTGFLISRVSVLTGNASSGANGTNGTGLVGTRTTGGAGGSGQAGCSSVGNPGSNGQTGANGNVPYGTTGINAAAGGLRGLGGVSPASSGGCNFVGTSGARSGNNGGAGGQGGNGHSWGANDPTPTPAPNGAFFVPADRQDGGNGAVGGSGGGGSGNSAGRCATVNCGTRNGTAGAFGGRGGTGGTGGFGGGGSFTIYSFNSNGSIIQTQRTPGLGGTASIGGNGSAGENGGTAANRTCNDCVCTSSCGGQGGNGGKGGDGGRGRNGAVGPSTELVSIGSTINVDGTSIPNVGTVTVSQNIGCRNSEITLTRTTGQWNFVGTLNEAQFVNDLTNTTSSFNNLSSTIKVYYPSTSTLGYKDVIINPPQTFFRNLIYINRDRDLGMPTITNFSDLCGATQNLNLTTPLSGAAEYQWVVTTVANPSTPLLTFTTQNPGAVAPPTGGWQVGENYQVRLRVREECCGWSIPVYRTFTVFPGTDPGTATAVNSTVCGGTSTVINLIGSAGDIQWQQNIGGAWSNVPNATGSSFTTPLITANTSFRARVENAPCPVATSNVVNITIVPPPTVGTISVPSNNICLGDNTTITLDNHTGNIQWQENINGTWTDIAGETNSTFNVSGLTSSATYRVQVRNGTCVPANSNPITINVDQPSQSGTLTANNTNVCINTVTSINNTGSLGNIQWQQNTGSGWSNIVGATGGLFNTPPLQNTTEYRVYSINGSCPADTSSALTINVDLVAVPGIASAIDTVLCTGSSTTLELTGHVGSIQWQEEVAGVWQNIVGADSVNFDVTALTQTINYRAEVSGGACGNIIGNEVLVRVDELSDAGNLSLLEDTICANNTAQVSTAISVGNIQWQELDNGNWVNIVGANAITYQSNELFNNQSYRVVATNGVCPSDTSTNAIEIIVNPLTQAPQIIELEACGNSTFELSFTPNTGEFIDWSLDGLNVDTTANSYISPLVNEGDTLIVYSRNRIDSTGCFSDWTANTLISHPIPTTPNISNQAICGDNIINYNSSPSLNQVTVWSLDSSNIFLTADSYNTTLLTAPLTDSVYVRYVDTLTSCQSDWGVARAVLNQIPAQAIQSDELICGSGVVAFTAQAINNINTTWALDTNNVTSFVNGLNFSTPNINAPDTLQVYLRNTDTTTSCVGPWLEVNAIASLELTAGTIGNTQSVCPEAFPLILNNTVAATSTTLGGNITYEWQYSDNCSGTWTTITGSNNEDFTEATAFTGQRCYRRLASNNCGTDSSNVITITVYPTSTPTTVGLNNEYCQTDTEVSIFGVPANGVFTGSGINGNKFDPSQANVGANLISYIFTDANSCNNIGTATVIVNPTPTLNFGAIGTQYCSNDEQAVQLNAFPQGGTFSGTGVIGNTFNPSIAQTGFQAISYSFTDNNGCSASIDANIIVFEAPNVTLSGLPDTACTTSPNVELSFSPAFGTLSGPSLDNNSVLISELNNGFNVFTYEFTDNNGCSDIAADSVFITDGSLLVAVDDSIDVVSNQIFTYNVTNNDQGLWSTFTIIEGVSEGYLELAFEKGAIRYTSYQDFFGVDSLIYSICDDYCNSCDTATLKIRVLREQLTIPTGFSPDGDGINDFFVIPDLNERYPNNQLTIVNRWGDLVYEAKPYKNDWDGSTDNIRLKLAGNRVIDGTYFYHIKLEEGEEVRGFVEVKRNK